MAITFEYTDCSLVDSSWLRSAYYNGVERELAVVTSSGFAYVYEDVEYARFEDLIKVYSPGGYYNTYIRGAYTNKFGDAIALNFKKVEKKATVAPVEKKFTVRAFVEFDAEVSAATLDEAVKAFLESHKDVPGIKIKEVVVPFGE